MFVIVRRRVTDTGLCTAEVLLVVGDGRGGCVLGRHQIACVESVQLMEMGFVVGEKSVCYIAMGRDVADVGG